MCSIVEHRKRGTIYLLTIEYVTKRKLRFGSIGPRACNFSQPEVSIIPRIGGGDRVASPTFRGWRYLPYLASHPVSLGAVSCG